MAQSIRDSQPRSLTHGVYDRLRRDVLSGTIAPGEKLNINDLCVNLGVSLGAVREALSRLAAEGLVVAVAQRGFQVSPVSVSELIDLTTVRIEIENMALRKAIEKGNLEWESSIVSSYHMLSRMSVADNNFTLNWVDAHANFHECLVSACDSPWLLRLRKTLYEQSDRYRCLSVPYATTSRNFNDEHKSIMEAVLNRDAPKAADLLGKHLMSTMQILLKSERFRSICNQVESPSPSKKTRSA